MIKAILFDAVGVLIHSVMFSDRLAVEHGISKEQTNRFFDGPFKECRLGNADLKEVIQPYLIEWGWDKGVDAFLDYWFKSEHIIDEKLIQFVQELRAKGIICVVATNQEKHRAEYMLEKMNFAKSFDKLYASAHIGYKKPNAEFYTKVIEDLGIEKTEALFFDDSEENVYSAEQFGMNAEIYTTFERFKDTLKQYSL